MPRMPNAERCYISTDVFDGHVLGWKHEDAFAKWGFTRKHAQALKKALKDAAWEEDYIDRVATPAGVKYHFYVRLLTPTGHSMPTEMIWMIKEGYSNPHLVTAFPDDDYEPPRQRGRR